MFSQKALIHRFFYVLGVFLIFLAGQTLWGQSFSGRIVGLVTDSSSGAVPNASVTVVNEGTGAERRLISDANGGYVAAELPVGQYTLRFEAAGFSKAERQQVQVDVGGETRADMALSVQTLGQSVEVNDRPPVLQQDSSALAEVIDSRQVQGLPINGHDFRKLAFLVPGASPRSPRGSLGSFTVNGQREKSNIFLIDGVDNNDSFRNQASFNQGGVSGAQATLFPIDALAEFSVQSQGSAEYGRNSGAVVNAVIKSGTNEIHGTVSEFLRNDKLDARNFFETLPGVAKAPKTSRPPGRRTRLPAERKMLLAPPYSISSRRKTFRDARLTLLTASLTSSTAIIS